MKVITEVGLLMRVALLCLAAGLVIGFALACSVFDDDRAAAGPPPTHPTALQSS